MENLSQFQLSPDAMYPVYGLAEASVAATFPEPGAPVSEVLVERSALSLEQQEQSNCMKEHNIQRRITMIILSIVQVANPIIL